MCSLQFRNEADNQTPTYNANTGFLLAFIRHSVTCAGLSPSDEVQDFLAIKEIWLAFAIIPRGGILARRRCVFSRAIPQFYAVGKPGKNALSCKINTKNLSHLTMVLSYINLIAAYLLLLYSDSSGFGTTNPIPHSSSVHLP